MTIRYFPDTDTLYIQLRPDAVAETTELDEDTVLDLDADGNLCALTIEHVRARVQTQDVVNATIP